MLRKILPLILCLAFLPVQAEETDAVTLHVTADGKPASLSFLVYESETAEEPLQDEEDNVITLESDEEGELILPQEYEGYFLRLKEEKGWHVSGVMPYQIQPMDTVALDHLRVSFHLKTDSEEKIACELKEKEKEEVIAVLDHDQDISEYLLEGSTYVIAAKGTYENMSLHPVEFEVSTADEQTVVLSADLLYPFEIALSEPVSDVSLHFEEEEKMQDMKLPSCMKTDQEGKIRGRLLPGVYHLKNEISDPHYYADTARHTLSVARSGDNKLAIALQPVTFVIAFNDASPYTVHVLQDEKEIQSYVNDGREHSIAAERNKTCEIRCDAAVDLLPLEVQRIETGNTVRNLKVLMQSRPFHTDVSVAGKDGQTVKGAEVKVTRLSDGSVQTVNAGTLSGLYAGEEYEASISSLPEGWRAADPVRFTAGKDNVRLQASSFVHQTISLNVPGTGFVYQAYRDEACTVPLTDLDGNNVAVRDTAGFALGEGTYYLKAIQMDPAYYPDKTVHRMQVTRQNGVEAVYDIALKRTSIRAEVRDENNALLSDVWLILKDEKGNERRVKAGDEVNVERGVRYALKLADTPEGYQQKSAGVFMLGEKAPAELPVASIRVTAISDLKLKLSHQSKPVAASYALYTDEACRTPAYDLDGNKAEGKTDQEGILHLRMPRGIYYLKQMSTDPHYFRQTKVRKIELKAQNEQISLESEPVVFRTALYDASGRPVYGAVYALLDENRKQMKSWKYEGSELLIEDEGLAHGKTYYLQCTSMPEGYEKNNALIRFTLPETYGQELPSVSLTVSAETQKKAEGGRVKQKEQMDMEDILHGEKSRRYIMILMILAGVLAGMIWYEKCKKCKNKKKG